MTDSRPSRLVSTHVAARKLGVSPATIRRWVEEGILPAVQAARGKSIRIPVDAVEELARPARFAR